MSDTQAQADNVTPTGATSAEVATQAEQAVPDFTSRISATNDPVELAKLTQEFFDNEGKGASDNAEVAPEVESVNPDEAEVAAEVVADEVEKKADEKPADEGATDKADDEDGDSASTKGKQFRVRGKDNVEERALELKKRNRDLSLRECMDRAEKEVLGDSASTTKAEPAIDGFPQTVEAAQEKLKELRAEKSKAMRVELDLAKADDLDLEMDKLRDHMVALKDKAQVDAAKAADEETRGKQQYFQEFNASQSKASSLYNFLSDDKSAGFARAREIDQQLEANGDPTHWSPNKPLIIAQMVAAELRIAPKSASTPVKSPAVATKPTVPQKPSSVIGSGGSRTVAQSTQTGQQLDQIKSISSLEDLRKLGVNLN